MNTTLIVLIGLLISGVSGYFLSYRFNRSDHAANDTSGDFGAPRGGFFALMSGMLVGMLLFNLAGTFGFLAGEMVGIGLIASMIGGLIGGVIGAFRGVTSRPKK